jgi:hypothetical protein
MLLPLFAHQCATTSCKVGSRIKKAVTKMMQTLIEPAATKSRNRLPNGAWIAQ